MFSHTKSKIGINISLVMFLQCFRIKPPSPRLTNIENLTFISFQSVQIWADFSPQKKRTKKEIMAIAMLFALRANTKSVLCDLN